MEYLDFILNFGRFHLTCKALQELIHVLDGARVESAVTKVGRYESERINAYILICFTRYHFADSKPQNDLM